MHFKSDFLYWESDFYVFFGKRIMQLFFHENIQTSWDLLKLKDTPEIIRQLRKVLRAAPGYVFCVQNREKRWEVELQNWTDKEISARIIKQYQKPNPQAQSAMLIALPNKQDKLELIAQKLTEIWIQNLFLWASERSVVKSFSPNKQERLHKIMQEALEQSRGWEMPKIQFITDLKELCKKYQLCIFDLKENSNGKLRSSDKPLLWVIGPEGGLTDKDYEQFGNEWCGINLGEQVLRMETAAIIWSWLIKQGKLS